MEPHLRLQRMAQSAIILAFGAVIMGSVGILAAWLGDGTATHIALILIFPGGLMVLVAAYRARQISDDEKRDLWPHLLSMYPGFDEYQARTDRNIPVFSCEP